MASVDWLRLPERILVDIFDHLDVKSLLRVTETCQTFAQVFISSIKLSRKVEVVIGPESVNVLQDSKRKYRNAIIRSPENLFGDRITWNNEWKNEIRIDRKRMRITIELKVELSKLRKVFSELEELTSGRGMCSFSLSMLQDAVNLRKIDVYGEYFENDLFGRFLMNQKDLKGLHLYSSTLSYDFSLLIPVEPPFQLEHLEISGASWANKDDLLAFFATQRSLRSIELYICNNSQLNPWFNDIFAQILLNENLNTINIGLIGSWYARLLRLPTNMICPSVIDLTFGPCGMQRPATTFMEFFVKAFPNVRSFRRSDFARAEELPFISSWHLLESLEIDALIRENLRELEVNSEKFTKFELDVCDSFSDEFRSNLGNFLERHQTIRHLTIKFCGHDIETDGDRNKESLPDVIDEFIAENIPQLETLSILYSRTN